MNTSDPHKHELISPRAYAAKGHSPGTILRCKAQGLIADRAIENYGVACWKARAVRRCSTRRAHAAAPFGS